jgi:hypothetical protein
MDLSNQSHPGNTNIFRAPVPPETPDRRPQTPQESSQTSYMECPNCQAFTEQLVNQRLVQDTMMQTLDE